MVEHLTREQIAALLDGPDAVAGGPAHLDVCSDCAGEYEAMSRTRMALSALPELRAPEGGWDEIRAALPAGGTREGVHPTGSAGPRDAPGDAWWSLQSRWGPLLTAAAILVLFLGGLGVGRMLAPPPAGAGGEGRPETVALEGADATGPAGSTDLEATYTEYPEYLRTVAGLQELRTGGPSQAQIASDPALAAERLTRLDALIEASREALQTAPADPALNDFLFDVVDERATVAGQLDRTLRQASMEY